MQLDDRQKNTKKKAFDRAAREWQFHGKTEAHGKRISRSIVQSEVFEDIEETIEEQQQQLPRENFLHHKMLSGAVSREDASSSCGSLMRYQRRIRFYVQGFCGDVSHVLKGAQRLEAVARGRH